MNAYKKLLIIDRDGTLILEPKDNFQIDSFAKLRFLPGVFSALSEIARQDTYRLLMVTNQDGLGTASFPEEDFWPVQDFVVQCLADEGIVFEAIRIDKSWEKDGLDTRKPGTGMLKDYLADPTIDWTSSYVIGDRKTDMQLAQNLGCKGLWLLENKEEAATFPSEQIRVLSSWEEIKNALALVPRIGRVERKTAETAIEVYVSPDEGNLCEVKTGLAFFDHMLSQLARHGNCALRVNGVGDLEVDEHHTVEDVAICLGEAFKQVLGDKRGIQRYASVLPMDESLATVAIDWSGRPYLQFDASFSREYVGDLPTEMVKHFFQSFCYAAGCNLAMKVSGENTHHQVEALFKAFSICVKNSLRRDAKSREIPSTKGVL